MSRIFDIDQVIDFDHVPPHHFEAVDKSVPVTVELNKVTVNPFKVGEAPRPEPRSFSEMQRQQPVTAGGFAGLTKSDAPITDMRDFKNPIKVKKTKAQ